MDLQYIVEYIFHLHVYGNAMLSVGQINSGVIAVFICNFLERYKLVPLY